MSSNARLGKGLSSIFGPDVTQMLDDIQNGQVETEKQEQIMIPVNSIRPNPYQPRIVFDETSLRDLASSIEQHGVFTPILVKRSIMGYDLVTGERRLRASKMAGLSEIPAIVVDFDDKQMMEISLLENIQRENLNVIEEAKAYEQMIRKLNYTQEQTAMRVGKSREHVTNMLRLLKLPEDLQDYVIAKKLSMGHVRALLGLKDEDTMRRVARQAINGGWSVRKVEQAVKEIQAQAAAADDKPKEGDKKQAYVIDVRRQLEDFFQTTVKVKSNTLAIHYENDTDLNRILEKLALVEKES